MLMNYFGLLVAVLRIGQGSTNGPLGWVLISDIMLKVYHKMSRGCQMTDPTKTIKVKCNTDMLVDNATLMHNNKPTTQATQLMQTCNTMQMHGAGCYGHLADHWSRPRIVPEAVLPPNTVTVTDADRYTAKLHQVTKKEGIKMLG
eukprot:14496790-Ditylum_brightwellii.AAC.1